MTSKTTYDDFTWLYVGTEIWHLGFFAILLLAFGCLAWSSCGGMGVISLNNIDLKEPKVCSVRLWVLHIVHNYAYVYFAYHKNKKKWSTPLPPWQSLFSMPMQIFFWQFATFVSGMQHVIIKMTISICTMP